MKTTVKALLLALALVAIAGQLFRVSVNLVADLGFTGVLFWWMTLPLQIYAPIYYLMQISGWLSIIMCIYLVYFLLKTSKPKPPQDVPHGTQHDMPHGTPRDTQEASP